MQRLFSSLLAVGVALTLAGCATTSNPTPTNSGDPLPSIEPSLIPTAAPADVVNVDPESFVAEFGDYTFRVGDGPTWCSINVDRHSVLCEQGEADALYSPIPAPSDCEFSYGYQVQLFATKPDTGKVADFVCSGGAYADPSNAGVLNSGEQVTLDGITCFVEGTAARCENKEHAYIVLGPKAWAFGG